MRHAVLDDHGKIISFIECSIKGIKDGRPVEVDVDPPSPQPGTTIVPATLDVTGDHVYKDGQWQLPKADRRAEDIAKVWKRVDKIVDSVMDRHVRDRLLLILADPDSKAADRTAARKALYWTDKAWDAYEAAKTKIMSGDYDPSSLTLDIPEIDVVPMDVIKSARKA